MKTCLFALLIPMLLGIARGELKWDRERAELKPGLNDSPVVATFGFANAGAKPVTIEKIQPSCGCSTASLPKMTIAPGERSELTATFDPTGRRGVQTKTVKVHYKGGTKPDVLTLVVTIPDLFKMTPPIVLWQQGDAEKSKTIQCEAMPGTPARITKITSSDPRMKATFETVSEGKEYVITVTPESTDAASFAVLTVETEYGDHKKKSLQIYAQVRLPAGITARTSPAQPVMPEIAAAPAPVLAEPARDAPPGVVNWDRLSADITAGPAEAFVEAKFAFTNTGSGPATVERIDSSCGCLIGSVAKTTIAPGERGELTARFDTQGRSGTQTKTLSVRIRGVKEPVVLTLNVTIPELIKMSQQLLVWEKDESGKAKTILCDAMPDMPVRIVKVLSSDARMKTRLETISEGKKYAIIVTPESTATASFAVLTVDAEFKEQKKSLKVYAQVKRSP